MLGNNYAPEFFNGIPDKAGDPLKRICEETLEDLAGYKKILQDFGVEVIQPEMDPHERFIDNPHRYPRGPLQPRDYQLVLDDKCLITDNDHPAIAKSLLDYAQEDTVDLTNLPWPEFKYNEIADFRSGDWPSYKNFVENFYNEDYFLPHVWDEIQALDYKLFRLCSSSCSFMVGNRLVQSTENVNQIEMDLIEQSTYFRNFNIYWHDFEGHVDGNFHPIKPGAILSLFDVQNYKETFPGWDVCYLPDQSWHKIDKFSKLKYKNKGKWWLAGEEDNDEFTHFVETWLSDWVGYVEETVFDVNVLMLDEHHCCVANPNNEKVNAFLKKHKVEPVYVPWRHRYFWDGGLHCITLDLYREGTQKDYFN